MIWYIEISKFQLRCIVWRASMYQNIEISNFRRTVKSPFRLPPMHTTRSRHAVVVGDSPRWFIRIICYLLSVQSQEQQMGIIRSSLILNGRFSYPLKPCFKPIIGKAHVTLGPSFQVGLIMVGSVLTGKRIVFSFTDHVLYSMVPSDCLWQHTCELRKRTRMTSVRIRSHSWCACRQQFWFGLLREGRLQRLCQPGLGLGRELGKGRDSFVLYT